MQMSILLALGAGKAVMAAQMFQNGTGNATSSMTMPQTVGEFDLVGCAGDKSDFSNYKMVAQSEHMSLNLCAASCDSKYFATHDDECHCGDDVAGDMTKSTPDSCAIPCPGNGQEACGGAGTGLARRGAGKLCTVYVRRDKPEPKTKLEYHIHTITACPPTVVDCPAAPRVTTQTKTITAEVCPEPEWHKKKIVCYGPNCAPEWPCHGDDCKRERVICKDEKCWTEDCPKGEDWSKLVIVKSNDDCHFAPACHDDDCNKKIVCYDGKCVTEKCNGDECSKNLVCNGDDCHYAKCDNNECHQKFVCKGENDCKVEAVCNDDHCPKPSPPKSVGSTSTSAPGGNSGQNVYPGQNGGNPGQNGYPGQNGNNSGSNSGNNKGDNGKWQMNGDNSCQPPNCKPAPGGTASGTGFPRPTLPPPMVGGAERNGITVFGVLAGLALLL